MLVDDAQEVKAVQSVEEAELASLGGWQQQEVEFLKQPGTNSSGPLPLLDEEDTVTPEEIKQERPWWMRGTWRMLVACSATFGVLHVMFSLLGLWGSSKQTTPSIVATDASAIEQEVTARMEQLETENENLRREQVMGEPLPQPSPKTATQSVKVPAQPKKVVYTSVPPRPRTVTQPVTPRRAIAYAPLPPRPVRYTPPTRTMSSPRPVASAPTRIVPSVPKERPDPTAQWLAAANIGSYGSTSPTNNSQRTSAPQSDENGNYQTASYQGNDDSGWEVSGGTGAAPQQLNADQTAQSIGSPNKLSPTESQGDSEQAANYSNSANSLIVGTKANGKLATAIAWSGALENPTQNFLIQLNEPLLAADNSAAIPKGAYLVAKVISATEVGLLQMSVSSMLVKSNGRTSEKPIPEGALLILGKGGRPLKATAERPNTTGNNLGMVILSGVSNATGLINRSRSTSVYSSDSYQSTITNDDPNYLAGFGQGAAQSLLQQAQNRNQRALRSREAESTVFVLNQGSQVQVFVNQSVSL